MTEKFDTEKHRFGMAYKGDFGNVAYPIVGNADRDGQPFVVCPLDDDSGYMTGQTLVRAPEHDLMPMADVKPLLDALNAFYTDVLMVQGGYPNKAVIWWNDKAWPLLMAHKEATAQQGDNN